MQSGANANDITSSFAFGISADGTAIVGIAGNQERSVAARWTASEGFRLLGALNVLSCTACSKAQDASRDGSIVVGETQVDEMRNRTAFIWTEEEGMMGLADLQGGNLSGSALAVSDDGAVVAGTGSDEDGLKAVRWVNGGMPQVLGDLPAGTLSSSAQGISATGTYIVGVINSEIREGFIWSEEAGMKRLGVPNGGVASIARNISSDGSVVVGQINSQSAAIWTEAEGWRDLNQLLPTTYGVDLTGWRLTSADVVSDDGTIIAGTGRNPDGNLEAWRADLGCIPGVGKQSSADCQCSAPVYTWKNQGATFTIPSNWDPEGSPPEDALVRFNPGGFISVDFNRDVSTDNLEVLDGRIDFNLDSHTYSIRGLGNCTPSLLLHGGIGDTMASGDYLRLKEGNTLVFGDARIGSDLIVQEGHKMNIIGDALIGNGGTGRLSVLGEGSEFSMRLDDEGQMIVGDTHPGQLWLRDNVKAEINRLFVGRGAKGEVVLDSVFIPLDFTFDVGIRHSGLVHMRNLGGVELVGELRMATEAGGYGEVVVEGGNENNQSRLILFQGARVGIADSAVVRLRNGALGQFSKDVKLGAGTGGKGTLEVSNSTLDMTGGVGPDSWLQVGAGGEGQLIMEEATATFRKLTIGLSGKGEASISQSRLEFFGEFNIDGNEMESKMTLADSSLLESLGSDIIVGRAGKGRLDVRSGSTVSLLKSLVLGHEEDGDGTLTLSGTDTELGILEDPGNELAVGNEGKGDLEMTEGARAEVPTVWIGKGDGGFGSAFVGGAGTELHAVTLAIGSGEFGLLQVGQAALVQVDQLWLGENGRVDGPVIAVGTFQAPSKHAVAGIYTGALLLSENAQLDVDSLLLAPDAILGGTATWAQPITNTGGVSPGDLVDPTGVFTAGAGYNQAPEGFLFIDLGSDGSDHLDVVGTAVLAGTLRVSVLPDFSPTVGQEFTIVTADELTGAFTQVEPQEGLEIEVRYNATEANVRVLNYDVASVGLEAPVVEAAPPASFRLHQNFPNPFNPQTVIRYTLDKPAQVSLVVYDLLGREVSQLVNEPQSAGEYDIIFEAGSLPTGMYIYQLQTNLESQTRRMTLLR